MIDDFQKLPPQALPVIRFLAGREHAAASEIAGETGLSERALGKAIRALVTRRFAEMSSPGVYRLSARGREALAALERAAVSDAASEPDRTHDPAPLQASVPGPIGRRLSVLVAQEWVRHFPAKLMVGFDEAPDGARMEPARVTLRVRARGCEVDLPEQTLAIPPHRAAGPVQFRVTPYEGRAVRVEIKVFRDEALLGGLFFEVPVSELPTPRSAEFHALGAPVALAPRK